MNFVLSTFHVINLINFSAQAFTLVWILLILLMLFCFKSDFNLDFYLSDHPKGESARKCTCQTSTICMFSALPLLALFIHLYREYHRL